MGTIGPHKSCAVSGPPIVALVLSPLLCGRFGYSDLKGAAGVCGGCGQAMGIESTFACNMLKEVELEKIGESRFRTFRQPMMSGVSHA
jgi:hypothetical protein